MATIGIAVLVTSCAVADPATSVVTSSWEPLPAPTAEPYPVTGSGDPPLELVLGEPVEIDGFLYEVVELRRWDRSTTDDGWCLAVQIHEETPDPDASDPLIGWAVRDETGRDSFFDFGCQDGTGTPDRPRELGADELQDGMAEGHRYWILFDVLDASTHLWLIRTRETEGEPEIALQAT